MSGVCDFCGQEDRRAGDRAKEARTQDWLEDVRNTVCCNPKGALLVWKPDSYS